jgi:hypothetical protein
MQKTELRGEFVITWDESSVEPAETNREWIAEVSAERPELLAKLGGAPRRFIAATRDLALQEARSFVDSMTVLGGGGLSSSATRRT